jgi:hypothetical protein
VINDWKVRVEFADTNSFIYILLLINKSFCFGPVERASAEEGIGRFLGVKSGYPGVGVVMVGEMDIWDTNAVGSMHPFTDIHSTEHRRLCSLHLRW